MTFLRSRQAIVTSLTLTLLVALTGCPADPTIDDEAPPVPVAEVPGPPGGSEEPAPDEPYEAVISGFRFTVPAGWKQVNLSAAQRGFVDAKFTIPSAGDEVTMTLSTVGGGVEANIERWIGQFRMPEGTTPETETLTVDDLAVTIVDLQGTFQGMPAVSGPAQENWRMLGAAYDGEPLDFYVKLTGPAEKLAELKEPFREFVTSARREQP
ncbi:hypothetical protein Mal4_14540 [Maioricimonas rarisocia]|uniref:Uncharacterized protein n=1 Tax=Maioricimonas rarisocia TaxID=2528026 RepID=A0A517Z3X6_9PLAN|nr:hypothetical protein [Maioricimonas rarisocia]QDU37146.1 hypothetical protein Mal4_14540 [Maioricimonas rarisocia]